MFCPLKLVGLRVPPYAGTGSRSAPIDSDVDAKDFKVVLNAGVPWSRLFIVEFGNSDDRAGLAQFGVADF